MNTLISDYVQSSSLAGSLVDASLKSFTALALAGICCVCWRRASAATRHLVWFVAVLSLPCVPLLCLLLPSWQRPLWSVSTSIEAGNELSLVLNLVPGTSPPPSPVEAKGPERVGR